MRTRSQQASPGGFVSLENEKTIRRTRSTRGASQSNASQSDPPQSTAESSATTQTATRSKPPRTAKKAAAPKKTSSTKTQSRKGTKRATRKTTHTQAASGDEEPESYNDQPAEHASVSNDAQPTQDPKDPESAPSSSKSVLSEPNTSERESHTLSPQDPEDPKDPSHSLDSGEVDHDPASVAPPLLPPSPTIGTTWPHYLDDGSDVGSPLSERSRTPSYCGSGTQSPSDPNVGFIIDRDILAQLDEFLASLPPDDPELYVEEVPSTAQSASAEPTLAEIEAMAEKAVEALPDTSVGPACLDSLATELPEPTVTVEEEVEALAERLSKLSLDFPVTVSSVELPQKPMGELKTQQPAETTQTAPVVEVSDIQIASPAVVASAPAGTSHLGSIYDDTPPQIDHEAWRRAFPPALVRVRQSLFDPFGIPSGPTSIFDDERQAAYYLGNATGMPIAEGELVSEALVPSLAEESDRPCPRGRRQLREHHQSLAKAPSRWPRGGPLRLSPIPEESEMSAGPSPIAKKEASTRIPPIPRQNPPQVPMVAPGGRVKAPRRTRKKEEKTTKNPLTGPKVNRKRSRTDAGNAERAAPETPPANKRRNLGPPGSTPYRRTPLSRRLAASKAAPYSERLRRRAVEREGRIHTTIFRIPQLIAQNEADRRASESPSPSPFPEEPETTFDFTVERTEENESTPAEPTEPQQSSAPETPRRGWNIRGLLRSVPASLSITRFFPFNRSPGTTESTAPAQPSSERINRTQPPVADTSRSDARSRRLSEGHLNEEPPAKRARKLSYSLFPAPIDRSLYLGDITKSPTETPKETPKAAPKPSSSKAASRDAQKDTTPTPKPQEAIASTDKAKPVRGRASATTKTTDSVQKKRKRSPSPDVIPNPVGSSYGMDLDYFCYSSDSEDETKDQSSQSDVQESSKLPPAQAAVRSAIRSETHPSKKVRFDASPEDTPSKLRARSTDPYRGRHFIGMGHGSPSSTSASASAPATPTPSGHAPGFIPNRQGTFQLDYDAFSEDSESSAAPSPSTIPASSPTPSETPSVSSTQVEVGDKVPDSEQPAPLTPRVPSAPPSTPAANEEALQRARSQAEKYKPKTPSGLRATSRYSSPMVATPDTVVEQPQAETPEQFGNDQFARDAEWLYENCPSGDLKQLSWPAKRSLSESLGTSAAALKIMNDTLKRADIEEGYKIFRQGLQEFEKATA